MLEPLGGIEIHRITCVMCCLITRRTFSVGSCKPISITKDVIFDRDKSKSVTVLGFEDPGDLVLFSLSGMTQIHQN